jgi:transposase-like protein
MNEMDCPECGSGKTSWHNTDVDIDIRFDWGCQDCGCQWTVRCPIGSPSALRVWHHGEKRVKP